MIAMFGTSYMTFIPLLTYNVSRCLTLSLLTFYCPCFSGGGVLSFSPECLRYPVGGPVGRRGEPPLGRPLMAGLVTTGTAHRCRLRLGRSTQRSRIVHWPRIISSSVDNTHADVSHTTGIYQHTRLMARAKDRC